MIDSRETGRIYSDPAVIRALAGRLREVCRGGREYTVMEVCGTHTMAIFRHGIRSFLPPNLRLISGPGCPVCVTPTSYLDLALALARRPEIVIATFGDLVRVPGSRSSLEREKAAGSDVRIVYSPLDAVELAAHLAEEGRGVVGEAAGDGASRQGARGAAGAAAGAANVARTVVFLAVGFETTIPAVAQAVLLAAESGLTNFRILSAHRRVVPALRALLANPELKIDGFLLPGHVSVVLGAGAYRFLEADRVAGVVTGFEPAEILRALVTLVERAAQGTPVVENQYARAVSPQGNRLALEAIDRVFVPADAEWRGLGLLPESGLVLKEAYARFDALRLLPQEEIETILRQVRGDEGCRCGEILCGTASPPECDFFGVACTPETPIGPCMVSSEGTCAAFYKYGGHPE